MREGEKVRLWVEVESATVAEALSGSPIHCVCIFDKT